MRPFIASGDDGPPVKRTAPEHPARKCCLKGQGLMSSFRQDQSITAMTGSLFQGAVAERLPETSISFSQELIRWIWHITECLIYRQLPNICLAKVNGYFPPSYTRRLLPSLLLAAILPDRYVGLNNL
jgi:hypothetical protein